MASAIDLSNANGKNVVLVNPDTNAVDVVVDVSKLVSKDYADLKVALAAFIGANQNLTQNGYQKLPGGLIIQWGSSLFTFTGAGVLLNTVTFPIAFTAQIYVVLPSLITNNPQNFNSSYGSLSLTSFIFYCSSNGALGSLTNTWFAIGR